jgi:hypothetical protein
VRSARPELTGAPRYMAMVLRFGVFSSYGTMVAWGSHLGNPRLVAVSEKRCTMVAMSSLTSVAVGAGSTDRTVLKTGKMGVMACVEVIGVLVQHGRLHNCTTTMGCSS